MRVMQGKVATTQVDRHGEQMSLGALRDGARDRADAIMPVLFDHDRSIPPAGRSVGARVEPIDGGHFALVTEIEIFEPGDDPTTYPSHEEVLVTPHHELVSAQLLIPDETLSPEVFPLVKALADLMPLDEGSPCRNVKKALISTGTVVVAFGLFVTSKIAEGFLKKIGEDGYALMKKRLAALFTTANTVGTGLEVVFVIADGGHRCEVRVCFDQPSEDVSGDGLIRASKLVDADLATRALRAERIVQMTYGYSEGHLEFLYGVRSDGIPFPFDRVRFIDPSIRGLSVGFTSSDGMPRT